MGRQALECRLDRRAWIRPSLGLTLPSLALSTFMPSQWAAGAVTMLWFATVIVAATRSADGFALFRGPGQVTFFVMVVGSSALLAWRRGRLEIEGRAQQQRLIDAAESERRRIERNIHDGAQQHLVSISVKLGLAKGLVDQDPIGAMALLEELRVEAQEALNSLRDMTRGTYPPVLADQGLGPALEAKARKAPMPVTVSADAVPRLPKEIETAIYFDGKGFDPSTVRRGVGLRSMAERMQALGGALDVRSAPEAGTTIVGRLPIAPTSIRVGEG